MEFARLLGVSPADQTPFNNLEQILWRAALGLGGDKIQEYTDREPAPENLFRQTSFIISPTLEQARLRLAIFSGVPDPTPQDVQNSALLNIAVDIVCDLRDKFRSLPDANVALLLSTGHLANVQEP